MLGAEEKAHYEDIWDLQRDLQRYMDTGIAPRAAGHQRHESKAVFWWRKAAEQDHAEAQWCLGLEYEDGGEVEQRDDAQAFKWIRKAAEQGHADAQRWLGVRYAKGDGVPNSPVEAYKWLNLAAAKGNAQAVKYRDVLRGMMTPAEVAEAEKRAAAFQPRKSGKDTEAVASQQVGRRGEPNDQGLGNAEGKPRVEAQATAERGEASAQLPVGASKQGPVVQHTNDALGFSLEVPASWRTSTIALAQAFAPSDVTIEKVGEGVFEGFAPRHEGTFQWLVVMAAGRQKWPIMETSQKCIHGAQLWDKSYKASVPREVTLPNVDGKCVSFTDEVSVNGSTEKGISIMVPHEQGYIIRMQFRADPQTFDASLNGWWGIANTLRLSSTHPPLTSEQQQFLKQADDLKQCLGNLTMIDACKEQLQRDHGLRKGTAIPSQLWKRFEGKVSFECPSGGTYSIGNVGEPSSCSIAEHQQWHLAAWRMGNER